VAAVPSRSGLPAVCPEWRCRCCRGHLPCRAWTAFRMCRWICSQNIDGVGRCTSRATPFRRAGFGEGSSAAMGPAACVRRGAAASIWRRIGWPWEAHHQVVVAIVVPVAPRGNNPPGACQPETRRPLRISARHDLQQRPRRAGVVGGSGCLIDRSAIAVLAQECVDGRGHGSKVQYLKQTAHRVPRCRLAPRPRQHDRRPSHGGGRSAARHSESRLSLRSRTAPPTDCRSAATEGRHCRFGRTVCRGHNRIGRAAPNPVRANARMTGRLAMRIDTLFPNAEADERL
jgi:hypothetical protein